MNLSPDDLHDLRRAVELLENPGFAARLTNTIGTPIEKTLVLLPDAWSETIHEAARGAIEKALDLAVRTLSTERKGTSFDAAHKLLSGVSGAVGGFFGVPALAVELPVSTAIMLRSIADIARSEGEDITLVSTRLACLEVFALGGRRGADDASETGYYAVRAMLANAVSDASKFLAHHAVVDSQAPALARLVGKIASRFGVAVSEKFVAQAVPAIGAIGGATVNLLFMDHFQDMARGHFIVRRLDRLYGPEAVRLEYQRILNDY